MADLRYAVRGLIAAPGFTAVVILTLAVGMGATTAIFSALKPILLEPLPYPDAERIAIIQELGRNGLRADGTFGMYRWMVDRNRSFESIAALKTWQPTLTGTDEPERLTGQRVTAGYFTVIGVHPAVGPGFNVSDDVSNGPSVVIVSDALWRRRLSADPRIIGRRITLDDEVYTVVGVMPVGYYDALSPTAEIWSLLQYDLLEGRAWGHHLRLVGRVRPGTTIDEASKLTNDIGQARLTELRPTTYGRGMTFTLNALADETTRGVRPMLLAIGAAVVVLLAITCANVTNLLLARGVRRRSEFALRAALGAGSNRLLRQMMTESLLIGAMGGVAGLALAWLGIRGLVAVSPPGLPRVDAIRIDGWVFLFGLAVTTLMAFLVGAIPAFRAARSDPRNFLREARTTTGGSRWMGRSLVVAEVAMAAVLLAGSGLLFRSLQRMFDVPLGFDSSSLLTMQVHTTGPRFQNAGVAVQFFEDALDRVRQIDGVVSASWTSQLPLSGDRDEFGARFISADTNAVDPEAASSNVSVFRYAVGPEYFETMRLAVVRGRALNAGDRDGSPRVAIVSESMARQSFPTPEAALGQQVRIGAADSPPYAVVGVVADVKQVSHTFDRAEAVYVTPRQWHGEDRVMTLVVRTRGDALALAPAVQRAIWSVDSNQPITRVQTVQELRNGLEGPRRFALFLFAVFAMAAVVLAAAGCYGVMAGYVTERSREIGVRTALGATRASVVAHIIRQGLWLGICGTAIGLVGSVLANRALTPILSGLSGSDPFPYIAAVSLLLAVAIIASAIPAWRAARIDPVSTLRTD